MSVSIVPAGILSLRVLASLVLYPGGVVESISFIRQDTDARHAYYRTRGAAAPESTSGPYRVHWLLLSAPREKGLLE